jgi:hypothetical protein
VRSTCASRVSRLIRRCPDLLCPLHVDSSRPLCAHGRHPARLRGFSKPDVRLKDAYGRLVRIAVEFEGKLGTTAIRKNRTFRDGGTMCSTPGSKASGFETRKPAAILVADIVGRLTGADKDRTLASQPRATRAPDRSQ